MPKHRQEPNKQTPQPDNVASASWNLTRVLNSDIRELDVTDSLRQLGQVRVMDWDFKTVIPAVKKTANLEVDVVDLLKRTANYKVMDWDFRKIPNHQPETQPTLHATAIVDPVSSTDTQMLLLRLKNFLEYVVVNLTDEPAQSQIRVTEIAHKVLRFKLILVKKDVAMLIGREGFTATAIRTLMKAVAEPHGVNVLLQIHSQEDEHALRVKEGLLK